MSSTPSEIFANRLKEARELRGYNQGELANRAKMQVSAISHFETEKRKPSFDNLRKLADALDVTTDYLLGRVKDPNALGAADRLHRHIDKLSEEDKIFAEGMLKTLAERGDSKRKKKE